MDSPEHKGWPLSATDRPSKIVCIGRNWAEHAKELGHRVPEEPILFLKPPSALLQSGARIRLPKDLGRIDHEIELGVIIGERLRAARVETVLHGIRGWCLALDLTARDLQQAAKKRGHPWTAAKARDGFCPVSHPLVRGAIDPENARLRLEINGETRQEGNTKDMVWSVAELLAYASTVMTLEPNDLVLTGTPSGVGPLEPRDKVQGWLDEHLLLEHRVA